MKITLSKKSIDFIINQEVVSGAYYDKKFQSPTWPAGESGITVGVGYDLGYNTKDAIARDWGKTLSADDVALLQECSGIKGNAAKAYLTMHPKVKGIKIPFEKAREVFINRSIVNFARQTLGIYPGLDMLKPDAAGALVSMVYNRGASLKGATRQDMLDIVALVKAQDYAGIAREIRESKRVWAGKGLAGLINRREAEAVMVEHAVREYAPDELLVVEV